LCCGRRHSSWIILILLDDTLYIVSYVERNVTLARYEPIMEQFLQALELVEGTSVAGGQQLTEPRLSTPMRDSWRSGRFWFDYAAR
jgi:hypothetical protein